MDCEWGARYTLSSSLVHLLYALVAVEDYIVIHSHPSTKIPASTRHWRRIDRSPPSVKENKSKLSDSTPNHCFSDETLARRLLRYSVWIVINSFNLCTVSLLLPAVFEKSPRLRFQPQYESCTGRLHNYGWQRRKQQQRLCATYHSPKSTIN